MDGWFTLDALFDLRLPGMPTSLSSLKRLANDGNWRLREGQARQVATSTKPAWQYHQSLLPSLAQAKLAQIAQRDATLAETREKRRALYWKTFQAMTDEHRQVAHQRHALIITAEDALAKRELAGSVASVEETLAPVLRKFGVSSSTYYELRKKLSSVAREDWLPALAPAYAESGTVATTAPCHELAWSALKSDYLRSEKPTFSSCYRRMKEAAKKHGWAPIPEERTLRRRMEAEVPRAVQILTREGRKRAEQLYPSQIRTKTHLHAMEITNTDGHKLDLFVQVPWKSAEATDKVTDRVILLGIQDIYSGKILSWRLCEAETWDVVRACIGDMVEDHGIPEHLYMDNGRAFASKLISGGATSRNRFKKIENEVAGLLKTLDIEPHFTKPYSGQSKPIERAWKDLAEEISKHPAMSGAYTGNKPENKPENYRTWAVPLDVLERHVAERIAEHNARTGRRSETAKGRSFDETFAESMRHPATIVRRATEAQRSLWMLAAKVLKTRARNGEIHFQKNVYWAPELNEWMGQHLTVRFDPEKLHQPVKVYDPEGRFICDAPCTEKAGYNEQAKAARHERSRRALVKLNKAKAKLHKQMSAAQLGELYAVDPPEKPEPIRPTITRIVTGNLAIEQETDAMSQDEYEAGIARGLSLISGDSSIIPFPKGDRPAGSASGRKSRAET